MICSTPITWQELVLYWAGDLAPLEQEHIEEHVMGCARCSAESARVAAVTEAVRTLIPPVISQASLNGLREQGMKIEENAFAPGRQQVVFRRGVDLLIHRLGGFDLSTVERVDVAVRVESSGALLVEVPNAPFDAHGGVLIACQRHFADLPADVLIEVSATESSGAKRNARYAIPHVYER